MGTRVHRRARMSTGGMPPRKKPRIAAQLEPKKESEVTWEVRAILAEKIQGRGRRYLVDWEGIDPDTGEGYEPSWEPGSNVSASALEAWNESTAKTKLGKAQKVAKKRRVYEAKQHSVRRSYQRPPKRKFEQSLSPRSKGLARDLRLSPSEVWPPIRPLDEDERREAAKEHWSKGKRVCLSETHETSSVQDSDADAENSNTRRPSSRESSFQEISDVESSDVESPIDTPSKAQPKARSLSRDWTPPFPGVLQPGADQRLIDGQIRAFGYVLTSPPRATNSRLRKTKKTKKTKKPHVQPSKYYASRIVEDVDLDELETFTAPEDQSSLVKPKLFTSIKEEPVSSRGRSGAPSWRAERDQAVILAYRSVEPSTSANAPTDSHNRVRVSTKVSLKRASTESDATKITYTELKPESSITADSISNHEAELHSQSQPISSHDMADIPIDLDAPNSPSGLQNSELSFSNVSAAAARSGRLNTEVFRERANEVRAASIGSGTDLSERTAAQLAEAPSQPRPGSLDDYFKRKELEKMGEKAGRTVKEQDYAAKLSLTAFRSSLNDADHQMTYQPTGQGRSTYSIWQEIAKADKMHEQLKDVDIKLIETQEMRRRIAEREAKYFQLKPEQISDKPAELQLGAMEFAVPLTMSSRNKMLYVECIYENLELVKRFLATPGGWVTRREEWNPMWELVDKLRFMSTHPDLIDKPATTEKAPMSVEASYAEEISTKFEFLHAFLDSVRQHDGRIDVVLLARRDTLDILVNFCRAYKYNVVCPERRIISENTPTGGDTIVHIYTSGCEGAQYIVGSATVIVAMDTTYDREARHTKVFRAHYANSKKLCPVIIPVIVNSIEHVDLFIDKYYWTGTTLWQQCLKWSYLARHKLGELPEGHVNAAVAGQLIGKWAPLPGTKSGDVLFGADKFPLQPINPPYGMTLEKHTYGVNCIYPVPPRTFEVTSSQDDNHGDTKGIGAASGRKRSASAMEETDVQEPDDGAGRVTKKRTV